jgi:hypothetical protein
MFRLGSSFYDHRSLLRAQCYKLELNASSITSVIDAKMRHHFFCENYNLYLKFLDLIRDLKATSIGSWGQSYKVWGKSQNLSVIRCTGAKIGLFRLATIFILLSGEIHLDIIALT